MIRLCLDTSAYSHFERGDPPPPTNDIWVAAATIRAGATLLSYDSHFRQVARLGAIVLNSPAAGR